MSDVSEAITRLSARFLTRAADDRRDLGLWAADPSRHADELRRLAHRVAGSAGTFGFQRLSALAGAAEDALLCNSPDLPARLSDVMDELDALTRDIAGRSDFAR